MSKRSFTGIFIILLIALFVNSLFAQTSSFVYQGKLNTGATAASGTYQFEFKLFDSNGAGNQVGQTISDLTTTVTDGIFAVNLDFGVQSFDGSPRYLEIGVRVGGSGQPYTLLTPRQAVTSTPYAVRSLNANEANTANDSANLGGIPAATYVQTTDARMSDERNPLPGSGNYVQNTTSAQASANFNISGLGKANIFEATQYNIGVNRVLSTAGNFNTFAGTNAGINNTTGSQNTFVGTYAGFYNETGGGNTFAGYQAGYSNKANINSFFGAYTGMDNTTGIRNSFFGASAGTDNTIGNDNAFFGSSAGGANLTGSNNSYFGAVAGFLGTSGNNNSYFGYSAGKNNLTGNNNSFFGHESGVNNTGSNNAFFGNLAGRFNTGGSNAFFGSTAGAQSGASTANAFFGSNAGPINTASGNSFFGYEAGLLNTSGSESAFFGYQAGRANTTAANNSFFGYSAGAANNSGTNNSFFGRRAGDSNTSGAGNSFFGSGAGSANLDGNNNAFFGGNSGSNNAGGDNNSFFGSASGQANSSGSSNTYVGAVAGLLSTTGGSNVFVGANSAFNNTGGSSNTFLGQGTGFGNSTGNNNTFLGQGSGAANSTGSNNTLIGHNTNTTANNFQFATAIGAGATVDESNKITLGRSNGADDVRVPGSLSVGNFLSSSDLLVGDAQVNGDLKLNLSGGGATALCGSFNGLYTVRICSSSRRYKSDIKYFGPGVDLVEKLVPLSFTWNNTGQRDVGFVAEEVAAVEPLLATYNEKGQVEGVKYAQITTILVTAVKEQQNKIEEQEIINQHLLEKLNEQQKELDALKALVCSANPGAAICQPKKSEVKKDEK